MEMCKEIFLVIPGKPVAKKTHRTQVSINWKTQSVKRWNRFPQRQEADELTNYLRSIYKGEPIDYGVFLMLEFFMPIPKRWRKALKEEARNGTLHHIYKPDATNLAKYYEDCMRGVIFTDDCRVVWATPVKHYAKNDDPRTEILIKPFDYEMYCQFKQTFGRGAKRDSSKAA